MSPLPSPKQTRNITLVGGSGTIGAPILTALVATGHNVTVLSRPDSSATFPPTVTVHRVAYDDEASLAAVLRGQDALILALNAAAYGAQTPLIRAAAAAGVAWVVPCEFGSDAAHAGLRARLDADTGGGLMRAKAPFRAQVEALGGASAWLGVVCNPWFDFSVRLGALTLGIDLRARTARLFAGAGRDGEVKANFTTLRRVGESLAALLALPDAELAAYRNAWVYFSSFRVSQRDVLAAALRATGTEEADWEVTREEPEEAIRAAREEVAKGNALAGIRVLFALLFSEGYGGDYEAKVVDYERLGLGPEDLDEVMKSLVKELGA
ncbi:hypothetical protein SLS62_007737 [Diatrype stigma]|uniref:NmrA-like domain-containing protein n=1 Tax=Diatrype stigma TaxID=117547 RepID=A0AAN9UW62_9PEZI